MLPKRICWLLISLLIISASVIIATRYGKGQTSAAPSGPRMKVLRRKDQLGLQPTKEEIASFQKGEEARTFKTKDFKDLPVVVTHVRNLQSETWHKDLEIDVKNVSAKPIYSILAYLIFPDDSVPSGESGIRLLFGNRKNIDVRRIAAPEDPHLDPSETFIFTIPEQFKKGLKAMHEKSPQATKKLLLRFSIISFGDGTGFWIDQLRDFRKGSKRSHHSNRLERPASVRAPPQDGCGTCGRYFIDPDRPIEICYGCDSDLATASPDMPCTRIQAVFFDCDGDGLRECPSDTLVTCAATPAPTPTPTSSPSPSPGSSPGPSPSPTCSPATKPNNTNCRCVDIGGGQVDWACGCADGSLPADNFRTNNNNGCPLNTFNQGDCCVCIEQNHTCAQGCQWSNFLCECIDQSGSPCSAPTPSPGGGTVGGHGTGGGGGGGYPCTEYYWVYYEFSNGRWEEIARWYAGCW